MIPESGFVMIAGTDPVESNPLPAPHAALYREGGLGTLDPSYFTEGDAPAVESFGEVAVYNRGGITTGGEMVSYVELRRLGVFGALLVDQFELEPLAAPCDLELIVYRSDGTRLFAVGNSPFHLNPYLDLERDFESSAVDFAKGSFRIGQFNARVLDKRTDPADQRTGFLTAAIASAGLDGLAGLRYELKRFVFGVGWTVIISGVVYDSTLNSSAVSYTLTLRDELQKAKSSRAFVKSNATVIPGGPRDAWGHGTALDPHGYPTQTIDVVHAIHYRGAHIKATVDGGFASFEQHFSLGSADPASVVPDGLVMTAERIEAGTGTLVSSTYTNSTRDVVDGAGNVTGTENITISQHRFSFPSMSFEYAADDLTYQYTRVEPLVDYTTETVGHDNPDPPPERYNYFEDVVFDQLRTAQNDGKEVQALRRLRIVWPTAMTQGAAIIVRILFNGETSKEFPFFVDTLAKTFVKNFLDGVYGGFDAPIRYNTTTIDSIRGRAFFFLTAPVDKPAEWLGRNVWAPLGLAPTLDATGAISPASNAVPADPGLYAALDSTNSRFPGSWAQNSDAIVNTIVFKYWRLFKDPDQPNGVGKREVKVKLYNEPSVAKLGERKLEFETTVFSAHGWAVGVTGGTPGDNVYSLADETGQIMASERYAVARDRYVVGPQSVALLVARSAFPTLAAGDWLRVGPEWMPNLWTGVRGSALIGQVVSIADDSCGFWRVDLEGVEAANIVTPAVTSLSLTHDTTAGVLRASWTVTGAEGVRVGFVETEIGSTANEFSVQYFPPGWRETVELTIDYTPQNASGKRYTVFVEPWRLLPSGGTANWKGETASAYVETPAA